MMAPLQGAESPFDAIQGWRPDKSGLTPGYLLSRLLREECGFAAAHSGKAMPFRRPVIEMFEAPPRAAAEPQINDKQAPVSQRLTAVCGGEAA